VELSAASTGLDKIGMVMDFKLLKARLSEVLEKMDHKYLNKLPFFRKINPTSENIAKHIYDCLKTKVSGLKSVTVWENNTSCATYEE
jgi:6-pyruvoyltetrahydropterin/6-carboxytetrahydropterin synthase